MYIKPYIPSMQSLWDDFIGSSRNGLFMMQRRYMDYHADRFPDASLMLFDNHDRLRALLPATGRDGVVSSHAGLTFGGWILGSSKPDVVSLLDAWQLMADEYRSRDYHTLIYKPVPHIYHKYPCEEDLYALFRNGAVVRDVYASSVIDLVSPLSFNTNSSRHVKRVGACGVSVEQCNDFNLFWPILTKRLEQRYGVAPVHSLAEIELLHSRFPDFIKLWLVRDALGEVIAGTVLFLNGCVVKAQYIGSSESGREINAVDFLFNHVIRYYSTLGYRYFDLGHSCEDGGRTLNLGLISQKCGYGARTIIHSTYSVQL